MHTTHTKQILKDAVVKFKESKKNFVQKIIMLFSQDILRSVTVRKEFQENSLFNRSTMDKFTQSHVGIFMSFSKLKMLGNNSILWSHWEKKERRILLRKMNRLTKSDVFSPILRNSLVISSM